MSWSTSIGDSSRGDPKIFMRRKNDFIILYFNNRVGEILKILLRLKYITSLIAKEINYKKVITLYTKVAPYGVQPLRTSIKNKFKFLLFK